MDGVDPALLTYYIKNKKTEEKIYSINELINTSHTSWDNYEFYDPNKNFWSKQEWTIEPEESLRELYKQRAIQIRESYDYLILYYSGGSDSSTILRTFLDNNIFLDEIVTYTHDLYENNTDLLSKQDTSVIKLKKESKLSSKTKITIHNITRADIFDYIKKEKWTNVREYRFNGNLTHFRCYRIDQLDSFKRPNSIAHVHGHGKPEFKIFDNYWHHQYHSVSFSSNAHVGFCPFFISIDFPKIQIKQHWEVIKLFESTNLLKELIFSSMKYFRNYKIIGLRESTQSKFSDPLEKCIRYGYGTHSNNAHTNPVKFFTYNYKELTECNEETTEVLRTILLNEDFELYKLYKNSYISTMARWQINNKKNLPIEEKHHGSLYVIPKPPPTSFKIKKLNIII